MFAWLKNFIFDQRKDPIAWREGFEAGNGGMQTLADNPYFKDTPGKKGLAPRAFAWREGFRKGQDAGLPVLYL